MKVGLFLPATEREMAGGSARWADLLAMATLAEQAGFDSLWVEDHLIFRFEGAEPQGPWECWSLLAALAAVTTRVELGPLVTCLGFRNPALLAKIADTVDEISGGRLILGIGAGWHEPDYTGFGYPFDHRVSRFEEALIVLHGLLRTGRSTFSGRYVSTDDAELRPRGPRPGGPPILIGSTGERMLGLLARYGDIWNAWAVPDVATLQGDLAKVDAACERAGRDPRTLQRSVCLLIDTPLGVGRPSEPRAGIAVASPAALAGVLHDFASAGIDHIQLWLDPNSRAGIEWAAQALEQFRAG